MSRYVWLCAALLMLAPLPVMAQPAADGKAAQPNPLDPPAPEILPPKAGEDWMKYENQYVGEQNDLTNPHRTAEEIVLWTAGQATDVMTFTSNDLIMALKDEGGKDLPEEANAKLARIKKNFSAEGWIAYATFMRDSGMIDRVRQQEQSVSTIVSGPGSVVDQGAAGTAYRWLVRQPVMVSFLAFDPIKAEQRPLQTGGYMVEMQVGRVKQESEADDGLVIETFVARSLGQ